MLCPGMYAVTEGVEAACERSKEIKAARLDDKGK